MRHKLQSAVATINLLKSRVLLNTPKENTNRTFLNAALLLIFVLFLSGKSFAQLNESFDGGVPASWTIFGNGVGTETWQSTTDGYLSTNGVSVNPSADNIGNQNTAQYFLVTPQLAVPANGEIQFYTKQASEVDNGANYEIRISTAGQPDINGFNIVLQTYTEANLNIGAQTTYEKKTIEIPTSIPAGLDIYIAFVAVNTQNGATPTGDEWFVDEVAVLEGCIEVDDDDVTIDAITVSGAQVSWSHPTATEFEIQVLPEGDTPSTGAGIPVSGTSFPLENLDEDTAYDVYIRAICDNATLSAYSGPYTFETLKFGLTCETPIIVPDITTTPYVLVDDLANWANPDISYTTQGTNCVAGTSNTNYLNGNKIFLTYTPTVDGLVTLTQTTAVGSEFGENCFNSLSSLFVYDSCADVGVNCIAGTITTSGSTPKTISNLLVQAGETYVIVVSSQLSPSAGICFSLEITSPTCAPPGDILYNDLTENSASFSWDNIGGLSDSWEYVVVPTGAGEPTGAGTPTASNTGNPITGLSSATTYDVYVRSVCNGTPGAWSAPETFTTQCSVFSIPYSTDFADATNTNPEPCWTTIDANGDGTTWAFIGGYATVVTQNAQGENNDFYISPQVNLDGVTQKQIRYKHRTTQGISTYSVRLSTTGVGSDNFTTIIRPEETINNTSFQEVMYDIPLSITGNVNIAFIVEPNTTETALRVSIDDVFIEDKPTCPKPVNPFVIDALITTNSADLFWNEGGSETQWEVVIQSAGTGEPTGSGTLVTTNFPYNATGLDSGTRYEFWVRAYCADDDQSVWVGPTEFITRCESYDTPFFESFNDDDADTKKFCWKIANSNNDNTTWTIDETHALLQPPNFNGPSGFNDYLISPAINIEGTKILKYKYRADFSFFTGSPRFGLEVLMSTTNSNPGSFSVIAPFETFTNPNYIEKSIVIQGSGTIYIAFRVPPQFTGGYSVLSIDDVSITDAPDCPNPIDLMVDTVSTNGAELSWSAGFEETEWNVVVQPAGTGTPTGTGVAVTDTNFTATDLTANTEYEYYVMANCGDGTSEWIGPVLFRTLCNPFTAPFVETFNSDSTTEDCWTVINNNQDFETWELNSAGFPFEGDQAAAMFTGTNGQNEDWLISPTITITENQRLRYYYRVNDSFFTEDLEVLLSTNGIGLDQFTTVLYDSDDDPVLLNNVEYKVKIINFPAGIVGDINIAFHVPFFQSTQPYRGQTLVIDNVNIEDIPECPEPTNIVLTNIADTSVQVAWDANGAETEWEISVQPSGTPAPVGDTDPTYLYSATTNPFTVTGLDPSTMYDIYVRAVCTGNAGVWTGPEEVVTKCSFENLCQYTFLLTSDSDISSTLDITQNNQVVQSLPFEGNDGDSFTVFLCSGVEFSVFFQTIGSFQPQYDNYQFEILDSQGTSIYLSPVGFPLRTTVYTGASICGTITCPQPTDLTISDTSVFSWTAGGSETQWEVAIQPNQNGTIPQSGTIVSTNSYTPTAADFNDPNAVTYEYFVRAICGTDDESFWSGPFKFVRNNDISNAVTLPINSDNVCNESGTEVSFIGATASSEAMTCNGVNNGDIWFDFTAEALIHSIEINAFTGSFRDNNGDLPYPVITMTLYKDNGGGNLEEISCSYENLIVAMYASELIVGQNYKLRLTLNDGDASFYRFSVCMKTPQDLCFVDTVNGGFEEPNIDGLSGIGTIITSKVVPGWRQNFETRNQIFIWESLNAPGFQPYEGGQCAQIITDEDMDIDPNDPNEYGLFRDFDSSEITLFDFSYAHLSRFDGNTLQLLAGPPGGPFTVVDEHIGVVQAWTVVSGQYNVPEGQTVTRFLFKAVGSDVIGNVIDAVNFVANNEIITESFEVDCDGPNALVEANGSGTWIASDTNPGDVIISDANSNSTSISGFVQPGTYTFTWKTSYCENDIQLTYNGIAAIPTVDSPIDYCLNDTAQPLTATASAPYTLIWYTQAVGGTGTTTAPTPDTSIEGTTTYYVANVDETGCEGPRAEIVVNVSESFTPVLDFSYTDTCSVASDNPIPTLGDGFATGGTFTSTTLTVDATTGEIDMASATVGPHTILYTFDGDDTTCTAAGTFTTTITFTAATTPVTGFSYTPDTFCILITTNPQPTLDTGFTTGGVFSSTTVTVNANTGAIDLSSATAGNHDITYTVEANGANCSEGGNSTTSVTITDSVTAITDFSYTANIYCADSDSVLPNLGTDFTTGGTFSAENGLSINSVTGEINVSTSTLGTYTVTYTVIDDITNCVAGNSSTYEITILDEINVAIEGNCVNNDYILTATTLNNSFNISDATITWMDANGNVVGDNSETFNVTQIAQNQTAPQLFSVMVEIGGCSTIATFTAEQLECIEKQIPKGISPDGNGKNDTLDLTGLGVTNITIFNRLGREVFKFKGTYTNEWYGQSNKGDDLPDGTYFYTIEKQDGTTKTGWIYINRAY